MAAPDPASMEWGEVAAAAKVAGALGPAWKKFIKTKFFVPILRSPDDNPKNFLLHLASADGNATLTISEVRERLAQQQGDGVVALSGADIVRRLAGQAGIDVVLRDSVFSISRKRADWLRSGIEVTKARVVTRKILLDAAPAAPLPVLRVWPAAAPATAPAARELAAALPSPAPALRFRNAMPVVLAIALTGIVAAVLMAPETTAPDNIAASAAPDKKAAVPQMASTGPAPALPVAVAPGTFVTFTPADNSFTVSVPGIAEEVELSPEQVRQNGDTATNHYRLQIDGLLYTMEVTDYRTLAPKQRAAEMDARQASLIGSEGDLIEVRPVDLRGATGREVRVRLPNGEERAARFVFVGSKFCMVTVAAPSGERPARQVDAFLNSFQLN